MSTELSPDLVARTTVFQGLNAYEEKDANLFFGRDQEMADLYQLIKANTVTIVFGKSGTGKTSLLNAGVFPKLKKDDCLPFRIRLEFQDNSPALMTQIMQVIRQQIDKYGFKIAAHKHEETLWEFFHREHLWKIVTPVLIFDQFEEIFTLANKYPAKKQELDLLLTELSDLIENTIPEALRDKYLKDSRKIHFNYKDQKAKIIFAFREDFLPEMESITMDIPSLKHSRFRLKPMNGKQAFEVITKTWQGAISDTEAKKIVYYLTNEIETDSLETETFYGKFELLEIDPSLLSQVCDSLDKERQKEGLDKISADFLNRFPKGIILSSIYHQALAESDKAASAGNAHEKHGEGNPVQEFVEENLVTEEGYRTKLELRKITDDVLPGIRILKQKYFIREEGNSIELAHDVIATIVKSDKDKRRTALAVAAANKRARRKAIKIIVAAAGLGLIVLLYFLTKAKEQKEQTETARKEYRELVKSTDSLKKENKKIRPSISDAGLRRQLDSMRARLGRDSATLMDAIFAKEEAVSLSELLKKQHEAQLKTIKHKEQKIDTLLLLHKAAEAKKDHYRMYQSHIDSILRFGDDTAKLRYHLRLIRQHRDGFKKKLDSSSAQNRNLPPMELFYKFFMIRSS